MSSDVSGPGLGRVVRLAGVALGLLALLVLIPTAMTYINPGHVGIVIHRAGGGVDATPLGPGLHAREPAHDRDRGVPDLHADAGARAGGSEGSTSNDEINVNSVEGQPLSLDVSMSFELDPTKVPALYTTFRTDIDTIEHRYVKQAIRQALQEVVGNEAIADDHRSEEGRGHRARDAGCIAQRLSPYGIIVKQFTINELRAPPAVIEAINQKNVMQQQALTAQNELQKNTVPGAGRLDQGGRPRQGDPRRGGGAGQGEPPARAEHHADAGAVRDEQAVERPDAAGDGRRDADDPAPRGDQIGGGDSAH